MNDTNNPEPADLEQRIAALVRTLRDAERELQELTGGQLDSISGSGGKPYLLREAQEKLRASEEAQRGQSEMQMAILNALPAHIALVDGQGVILAVNEAWRRFGIGNSMVDPGFGIGRNYLEICDGAQGECSLEAPFVSDGIRYVLAGKVPDFFLEYPCHSPTEPRWFRVMVTPLYADQSLGAVVMHVDVTQRKLSEIRLHRLNRLHTVLSRTGEMIVRTSSKQELFESVCRIVVEDGLLRFALIVESDPATGLVIPVASHGEGREHLSELRITTDGGPLSRGTVGTALRTGTYNVCNDFMRDPRMDPWREIARKHGFLSTASFPIKQGDTVTGALVLHAAERAYFEEDEIRLMVAVANDLSFAIESQRREQERRQAEVALRASEAGMAEAQRIAHFGSWELDLVNADNVDANALRWSDEMFRIAGFEPGSVRVTNELFFSLVPVSEHESIRNAVASAIRDRQPYTIVHRLIRPDGVERTVHETAQIFFDEKTGVPLKMIGTAHDITEQRKAEEALRRSEREQRELAGQLELERARLVDAQSVAKVGSWETDLTTLEVRWSGETHRIFGTDPETYRPTHAAFLELVHPEDREAVDSAFFQSVDQKEACSIEHRLLLAGGTVRFVEERWRVIHDPQGKPVRAIGTCQDITERKLTEQERERLFNYSLDMLCISGFDGWFKQVNPAWTECLGWSEEEFKSRPVFEFVHPDDLETSARVRKQLVNGISVRGFENRYLCKDGSYRWLSWSVHPIMEARQVFAVARDVTERKLSEAEALRSAETLSGIVQIQQEITNANLPLQEVMNLMAGRAQMLAGATGGVVEIIEGDEMVYQAATGTASGTVGLRLKRNGSLSGTVSTAGSVLYCEDAETDPRVDLETCRKIGIRSMVIAPLRAGDDVVGVLKVFSDVPKAFKQRDVNNLLILVETLGGVIQRHRAAERLRASEKQYRLLFQNNPHPMWAYDSETLRFVAVNDAAVKHYGYSEAEFLAMTLRDIRPIEDVSHLETTVRSIPPGRKNSGLWRHRKKDGTVIDVEVSSDGVVFNGRPARLVLAHDVTERLRNQRELARTNRALKMLSQCNEALIHADDEFRLLNEICKIAVENGGYHMAWVGYAQDNEARTITPMAHAGAEAGYLSGIEISWSETAASGRGPAGQTIRSGEINLCEDITLAPEFARWVGPALERGYRSVICLPLRDGQHTFGLLGMYASEVHSIGSDEIKLLQELADDLAFGITNLRSRIERRRLQGAVMKVAAGVSAATGTEFFERLASNMAEALGAQAGFVAQLLPGEPLVARTIAAVVDGAVVPNFDYHVGDTPCANLMNADEWVVTQKVAIGFPRSPSLATLRAEAYVGRRLNSSTGKPLGLLFVIFRERLKQSEFIASTLQIFAARAAAEIERQQTDAQVREQAALLDIAHEAILVKDLDDTIIFWNKGAERTYGWTAAEAIGLKSRDLLHQDEDLFNEAWARLLADGEWQGEMTKSRKDGRRLTLDVRWTLVRDGDGVPKSILAINSDITEKKKLESQYLRAQRMESIGTLAGGIAHDLNNVLAPILMSVEMLEEMVQDKEGLGILATLKHSAQRGSDLVKQVLSFARGVEGKRIQVNMRHLLTELFRVMQDTFPKSIDVRFKPSKDLWVVTGDPTQLHQVFMNLCVNARDAMPKGGNLTVSLENAVLDDTFAGMNPDAKPGAYVMVKVEDTGAGIPATIRDRIFEPFFTTKEIGKGTGLGLSTSMAIVRSHGGFIHLYSEVGMGTKFKVYLPAITTAVAAETVAVEQTRLPRGKGEMILLVDDEEGIRKIAQSTLERFGYKVMLACHGAEAVSIYARHQGEIDLVLTDMAMPIMDGPALIIALRAMNPKVRIIGSSGLASSGGVAKAIGAGVEHFIPKPYTAEAMLKMLRQALSEKPDSTDGSA